MSTFHLTIVNPDGDVLDQREYDNERGAKGATTRIFNARRDEAVRIQLVDDEGFVYQDLETESFTEALDAAQAQDSENVASEALDNLSFTVVAGSTDLLDHQQAGTSPKGKRMWKVHRYDGGPLASFGSKISAAEYAAGLESKGIDHRITFGDLNAPKACACGCGQETKGGDYLPGHDRIHYVTAGKALTGDEGAIAQMKASRVPGEDAIHVHGEFDPDVKCDTACEFAASDKCVCSCAGANHGTGWGRIRELIGA